MKILLVLTDSSPECSKAVEMLKVFCEKFEALPKILVILEDLYTLEKVSVSLGLPLPPSTVEEAKEKVLKKVKRVWKKVTDDEEADIEVSVIAGELDKEILSTLEAEKPQFVLWGCEAGAPLCRILEEISIPSLIIK